MGMRETELMNKSLLSDAAITKYLIVKLGSDDEHVAKASAASDAIIGVAQNTVTAAEADVAVMIQGISRVTYGGTVTRGANLTADSAGKAIVATTTAQNIIGIATVAGVSGDVGGVLIDRNIVLGPTTYGEEGLHLGRVAKVQYDFSVDAGAQGDVDFGVSLPANAFVTGVFSDEITALTSGGSATVTLKCASTALTGAIAFDTGFTGAESQALASSATAIKIAAGGELKITIGTADLTAGKVNFFVPYYVGG